MSTLRTACPSCSRTLELPLTAVGRMAKCPACDATFQVQDPNPPALKPAIPREPQLENPYAEPDHARYQSAPPPNPYQSSYAAPPVAIVDDLEIVERAIEDIFSPTLSIFGARWMPMIVAPLIVIAAAAAIVGIPAILLAIIADAVGEGVAAIGFLILVPVGMIVGSYAWVGLTRVSLAVARDEPSPLSELLPPMRIVWNMIVAMLALTLMIGGAFIAIAALLSGAAWLVGGQDAALPALGFVVVVFVLASVLPQWFLWPMPFIICDGKSTAIGSIRAGLVIAMHNKLTSFLLILISVVLSFVGSALCQVGQLVTTPLTLLMFAVAYLLITNQSISNPKDLPSIPAPRE